MVKHSFFLPSIIFLVIIKLNVLLGQTPVNLQNYIELRGTFFRAVPYEVYLKSSTNNIKIVAEGVNLDTITNIFPYTEGGILRFNISNYSKIAIKIEDTLEQKGLIINGKVKEPPVDIVYYVNGRRYPSKSLIKKEELLSLEGRFMANVINFDCTIRYKIKEFKLTYVKEGKFNTLTASSSFFTNEQKEAIENIPTGSILIIDVTEAIDISDGSPNDTALESFIIYMH